MHALNYQLHINICMYCTRGDRLWTYLASLFCFVRCDCALIFVYMLCAEIAGTSLNPVYGMSMDPLYGGIVSCLVLILVSALLLPITLVVQVEQLVHCMCVSDND